MSTTNCTQPKSLRLRTDVRAGKNKENCYFHHNCPADGIIAGGPFTKSQCKRGGGKSWGMGPTDCENVNP